MKPLSLRAACVGALPLLISLQAQAHEGHGLPGTSHWHSTDIWGFVALAGVMAVAAWWGGRK